MFRDLVLISTAPIVEEEKWYDWSLVTCAPSWTASG